VLEEEGQIRAQRGEQRTGEADADSEREVAHRGPLCRIGDDPSGHGGEVAGCGEDDE
jgi:hypothetical protein